MILRILNPPHTGAQAEIGPEALAIGSGMDCDLILNDPLLQPEHCKVRLKGEGIEIELTGGAAHLDGTPMEKSPFFANAGQVLTIGSTHMAFGRAGDVWDAIEIPALKSLGGHAPAAGALEPENKSASHSDALRRATPLVPAARSQTFKIGLAVAAALVLVVLFAVFFYNADQKRAMESMVREGGSTEKFFNVNAHEINLDDNAASKVAEQVKREVSGVTLVSGERSGKAFLRIYVRSRAQANEVQKIVNASPVPVFTEIVCLEEIEKSAEMMAGMKGFALEVTFAKDGTAYWTGYMPKLEDWTDVKARMEIDLPYIKENVNNLTFAADIEKRAAELLAEAGIKTPLYFSVLHREIVISGTMPENQTELWSKVCDQLRSQFGTLLTIVDKVGSGKPVLLSENPFHSPIVGVTLGSIPAVLLLDGQRIYEGAILKDGSVLKNITESDIILSGPHGARSLPLNNGALENP